MSQIEKCLDGVALVSFADSVPRGHPDMSGYPTVDPTTMRALMSPESCGRKFKDYIGEKHGYEPPYNILIRSGSSIVRADGKKLTIDDQVQSCRESVGLGVSKLYKERMTNRKKKKKNGEDKEKKASNGKKSDLTAEQERLIVSEVNRTFFDSRFSGSVLNVGSNKLPNVVGAVRLSTACSVHPVSIRPETVARQMVTHEDEKSVRGQTFGRRGKIPFALFLLQFTVLPRHARQNGFDQQDLREFLEALLHCWHQDASHHRRGVLRHLWLFAQPGDRGRRPLGKDWSDLVRVGWGDKDPYELRDMSDLIISLDAESVPKGVEVYDLHQVASMLDEGRDFA